MIKNNIGEKIIFFAQLGSMLGIWLLFIYIIWWLSNSIKSAIEWHDAPITTIIITIIAMIIFVLLVSILTYVFVGLQLGKEKHGTGDS